jgi:hypothetical protein
VKVGRSTSEGQSEQGPNKANSEGQIYLQCLIRSVRHNLDPCACQWWLCARVLWGTAAERAECKMGCFHQVSHTNCGLSDEDHGVFLFSPSGDARVHHHHGPVSVREKQEVPSESIDEICGNGL